MLGSKFIIFKYASNERKLDLFDVIINHKMCFEHSQHSVLLCGICLSIKHHTAIIYSYIVNKVNKYIPILYVLYRSTCFLLM